MFGLQTKGLVVGALAGWLLGGLVVGKARQITGL